MFRPAAGELACIFIVVFGRLEVCPLSVIVMLRVIEDKRTPLLLVGDCRRRHCRQYQRRKSVVGKGELITSHPRRVQ